MRLGIMLLVGLGIGAVAGCCGPAGYWAAYPGRPLPPAPCDRCGSPAPLPPPGNPAPLPAQPGTIPAGVTLAPPLFPSTQSNFAPPVAGDPPFWRFNPDGSRLYPPLPSNPGPLDPPVAKLLPPQSVPPSAGDLSTSPKESVEPPTLPADIPSFALVRKGVASGQQPFPEGVKWLKDHGYKTVLHVRPPTETDTAAKRVFENRGLTYVSIEFSPQTLTKDVVDRFNQIVADEKNQPLFVFDKDSTLAGALWYLHFRTTGGMGDEKARAESSRLGFKQDDEKNRDLWLAIQNYLRNQNP